MYNCRQTIESLGGESIQYKHRMFCMLNETKVIALHPGPFVAAIWEAIGLPKDPN